LGLIFVIKYNAMNNHVLLIAFLQINICMYSGAFNQFNEFYLETSEKLSEIDEMEVPSIVKAGAVAGALALPMASKATDNVETNEPPAVVQTQETKTYGEFSEKKAINVVAKTLYDEARGEDIPGLKAVASVIYNRAGGDPQKFPSVCLKQYQFSGWNGLNDTERTAAGYYIVEPATSTQETKDMWILCNRLAEQMFDGKFTSTIDKRNVFYNPDKSSPKWGNLMKHPVKIGNHKFGYLSEYDGFKTGTEGAQIAKE